MSPRSLFRHGWSGRACTAAGVLLFSLAAVSVRAEIFINELDADQAGTDAGEFIELYNSGAAPVTLTDHVLVFFNGSDDQSYLTLSLSSLTVPAGGFLVIGNTGVPNVSAVTFPGNSLQNGQDAVALYSGVSSAAGFPNATPVGTPPGGAVLVDAVVYDTADGDDPGLLAALTPGQPQIDEGAGGAGGPAETNAMARVPDGGTRLVTTTYIAQTPTPGAANSGGTTTPILSLAVTPSTFLEDGSTGVVTGTVTRTGSTTAALTVTLTSANPAEATVPATVEIAIGQTQQTFTVTAVDDLISDGNKTFNLSAAATGFTTVTRSVTVQDNEPVLPALDVVFDVTNITEGSTIATGTVSRPDSASLPALTVTLTSSNPAEAVTDAPTVVIPDGSLFATFVVTPVEDAVYSPVAPVIITVSAPGFANDTATINVTDNDLPPSFGPPTVVVNKFSNTSPELIELLVVGNGTPGATVDMRRMVIKDFSSSMGSDGGQGFRFANTAFFSAVKVGTLMVLSNSSSSTDITQAAAGDFNLSLGLTDPAYFTAQTGTGGFEIANSEMIMIKQQDAEFAGVAGSIHALATGTAGAQFNLTPESKLIASLESSTNNGVIALNSTSSLADYNGTEAQGNVPLPASAFGVANDFASTGPNAVYIRNLRGITNINGLGVVSNFANATPGSPYAGVNIFPRNATGQVVAFTLTGTSSGILKGLRITVPAAFGPVAPGEVSVTGAGAGTPVTSIAGQDITVTGLALTNTEPVSIALSGRVTPNPVAVTDEPNYPFALQTSEGGTVFAATGVTPAAAVLIPISALRDVNASGVPLDLGKTIAIEGVCTEAQFSSNAAGDTTAFFQDGDFGLGLFISATPLNLQRGTRYALTGPLSQFNGLSQISLPAGASANVIDRGPGVEPTPLTITLTDLFANPEAYEGRVIKVLGLGNATGNWRSNSTVTLTDSTATAIQVRIQAGSGATTPPASYPANITGIFSQFDSSNPYTAFYQLQPREPGDLEVATVPSGYLAWAAAFPGIGGENNDADGDGQSNFLEYTLGSIPNNRASAQQPDLTPIAGRPAYTITKGTEASTDPTVQYRVEGSSDLITWAVSNDDLDVNETSTTYSVRYLGTSPKYYFRLKVGPPPPP